jgi:Glycosyl transferase family 2
MKVSVVIPTFSRPELLRQALESLARQSYADWEAVIVDDGSDPQTTRNQIAPVVGDRFRLLRHPQRLGTAAAKNSGLAAANGDLVTILDDDDLLEPFALQRIVDVFVNHLEIDCLFLNIKPFGRFADEASVNQSRALGKVINNAESHREGELVFFGPELFAALLQTTPISMQRPVARPLTWRKIGGFTPGIMCPEPAWSARAALLCNTALIFAPVYRWRLDGQNYASHLSMRSAASNSILEDRLILLRTLKQDALSKRGDLRALRRAIATLMLDQATYALGEGKRVETARRLGRSLLFAITVRSIKIAARLLLPASVRV